MAVTALLLIPFELHSTLPLILKDNERFLNKVGSQLSRPWDR